MVGVQMAAFFFSAHSLHAKGPGLCAAEVRRTRPLGHTEPLTLRSTVPPAHLFCEMISKGSFALPTADRGSEAREQPKGPGCVPGSLTRAVMCAPQGSTSRRGGQRPDWVRPRVPGPSMQIHGDFRPRLYTHKDEPVSCPSWPGAP